MDKQLSIKTGKLTQMIDITGQVQDAVRDSGVNRGLAVVYVPHTTCGVTINEGADPSVRRDIVDTLNEVVPWERVYGHAEGNSPAHIKASLMGASATVLVDDGALHLGHWQSIFLCEFDGPRDRQVWVRIVREA